MATAKMLELQERKNTLYTSISELNEIPADEWDAEREGRWEELNKEYDQTIADLDEAHREDAAAKERAKRMLALEESELKTRNRGAREELLRGPNGIIARGNDGEALLAARERRSNLVLQGWLRHVNGRPVTEEQRQAAFDMGVRNETGEFSMQLPAGLLMRGYGAWNSRGGYCTDGIERQFAEQRQNLTTPDSAGGYTIPQGFMQELERALLDFGGVRRIARIWRTTGANPVDWPTTNDTGNKGVILAENTAAADVDIVFGNVQFIASKFSSGIVTMSQELLEDSAFNLSQLTASMLGERIGRGTADYFVMGTGTSQPEGVTNCPAGVTLASSSAFTAEEWLDLIHAVDPAYRYNSSVGFAFADSTLLALRKLQSSLPNYFLWQPGMQLGEPDRIFGYPYVVDQSFPDLEVNAKIAVFGDWSKFVIRDHAAYRFYRMDERYRERDVTGFVAFSRHDSRLLDAGTGPLQHMAGAAT